jgi:putative acetyltransferase
MALVFAVEDPRSEDVRVLLGRHLEFAYETTPPGHVHALSVDGLLGPDITLYGARRNGEVLGLGALRRLTDSHAEIKSMHTKAAVRGQGVGLAMLLHLLSVAAAGNYARVSLETGTMEAFAPARSLYESAGFVGCAPFGDYTDNPHSVCMTLLLV